MFLSSLLVCYTSSFLTRSVQFIFSILFQYHISKLCWYFMVTIKVQYLRYNVKVKTVPLHAKQTQSEYFSISPSIDTGAKLGWVASATPGEVKRYPLCRRLGAPRGRSGRVRNISPSPWGEPLTFHSAASCYTDWAILGAVMQHSNYVSAALTVQ